MFGISNRPDLSGYKLGFDKGCELGESVIKPSVDLDTAITAVLGQSSPGR